MAKKGVRIWTCDGCGKRETWRKGWGYLREVESPNNATPDGLILPMAGCSDACLDKALDRVVKGR
jgi:hypothetical protein